MAEAPANPLPPCPGTPNCVRESRTFAQPPDVLFAQVVLALDDLRPIASTIAYDARTVDAVFRVFIFKDDVNLLVAPHDDASILYIRSASRVGKGDLGVNRRRVDAFYKRLQERLEVGAAKEAN